MNRFASISLVSLMAATSCTSTALGPTAFGPAEQRDNSAPKCALPQNDMPSSALKWEAVKGNLLKEWERFGYRTIELDGQGRCAVTTAGIIEDDKDSRIQSRILEYFEWAGDTQQQTKLDIQCEKSPWSAAFISWVMMKSGAVLEPPEAIAGTGQFCSHIGHVTWRK